MSRFLLTVWPFQTHLNPFLAVAHSLRQRGHEVAFYTAKSALEVVQDEGFRCFSFDAVDEAQVKRAVERLTSNNWLPGSWREFMLGTVPDQLRDLENIWQSWEPDVVLCDIAMWGPILVWHELKRVPVALLSHVASCLLPGAENPRPGTNWLLKGSPVRPLARIISWALRAASTGVPRAASKLRESWGLPPLAGTVTEFTGQLPLYLVPTTPEFDCNRRDLPASVRYLGPCLWDKSRDHANQEWINSIPADLPRIIVSEGTIYPDKPSLLRTAARALANLPLTVILVAGQGRGFDALNLGTLASNVRVEPWAPLSDFLPKTDVLVSGGDSETVMAALKWNVRMVLVPSILDQPEVSWLASKAGVALRIPSWNCSPKRLRLAVNQALTDDGLLRNSVRISRDFAEYSGGDLAVRLLEDLRKPEDYFATAP